MEFKRIKLAPWVCLAVLVVACSHPAGAKPAPSGAANVTPESLPADAQILEQLEADLDTDGKAEQVAVFQQGRKLVLRVAPFRVAPYGGEGKPWSKPLPEGATFTSLSVKDVNADRNGEVLLEVRGPEPSSHSLWVIRWAAGQGEVLPPLRGPLAGSEYFRSKYYPPLTEDLDGNNTYEIVVAADKGDPHFLDSLVYEWGPEGYALSDLYFMPPRLVPTATP